MQFVKIKIVAEFQTNNLVLNFRTLPAFYEFFLGGLAKGKYYMSEVILWRTTSIELFSIPFTALFSGHLGFLESICLILGRCIGFQ